MLAFVGLKAAQDLSEPDGGFMAKDDSPAGTTNAKIDGKMNFKLDTKGAKDGGKTAMDAAKSSAGSGGAGQRPPPGR